MALKLQLAHCGACEGYYSSTVLNTRDLHNPEIIDHYFYHGEPWFTLDRKTFDLSVDHEAAEVRVVDFLEHLENDHSYCQCAHRAKVKREHHYYQTASGNAKSKIPAEDSEHDIYFYDLYITYNNFHQDIPVRQAI
jgi:hypothetical protein